MKKYKTNNFIILLILVCTFLFPGKQSNGQSVVYPESGTDQELLAAKEVRRYIYLRTGNLLNFQAVNSIPASGDLILIGEHTDPLIKKVTRLKAPAGGFIIKSENNSGRTILVISGDNANSTLYGAYRFAEKLGCRFYFHGDVIPDKQIKLDIDGFDEQGQPLTNKGNQLATRGVQPFQNFPPGAVMWTTEDWEMYITQLPKMGMNFIGLHTYMADPEDDHVGDYGPLLNIWLGHEGDLNPDGTVDFAYDATFFHTHQDIIGWGEVDAKEIPGGAGQLFPTDGYPPQIIGETYHHTQAGYTESFNKTADLFSEVFSLANDLGIKTATGIEVPTGMDKETGEKPFVNGIPEVLQNRLKNKYNLNPISRKATAEIYKGMYQWLRYNDIPVDYFWIWTKEIWMPWGEASKDSARVKTVRENIRTAINVYEQMNNKPFNQFALGGWIFGAQGDPDVFEDILPDLNFAYSFMNPAYNLEGEYMETGEWIDQIPEERVHWPFTWFEYDYALEQPIFFMDRIFSDARRAYQQKADGFIAEFWRTKMLTPMFALYKDLTWDYAATGETIKNDLPSTKAEKKAIIDSIYLDWAIHEFGNGPAATQIAEDLSAFEKNRKFPDVVNFSEEGPNGFWTQGYITGGDWFDDHDWGPWSEEKEFFTWFNKWDELRSQIQGAGNRARFDYWYNVYKGYKQMCRFACELNQYEAHIENKDLDQAARHRSKMARLWEQIMSTHVQRVYDEIDLGVILNLEGRTWKDLIEGTYDTKFIRAGGSLPEDKDPIKQYTGDKFITCIPVLTQVKPEQALDIKALIMGDAQEPTLYYRTLGNKSFKSIPIFHDSGGVYRVTIPGQSKDFEWYITASTSLGDVVFPVSAGKNVDKRIYQTVVVTGSTH